MKIRKARKEDIDSLVPLWYQMHTSHYKYNKEFYRLKPKEAAEKVTAKYFEDSLKLDQSIILVAEINQKIVGYLKAEESTRPPVFPENQKVIILDSVVIDEKFRGQGIYKKLQKELETEARKRNVMHIELCVDIMNTAKNIYESEGYEPRQLKMIKRMKE